MGRYDWEIPLRSGIVGAVVFLIIDILCLWSIHRGLMAIQAYKIIRRVSRNESVRLKRSSIPIISGELLEARSIGWYLNWLVMANVMAIIVAFLISFGIDGATVQWIEPRTGAPLLYQTALRTVSGGGGLRTNQPAVTRCREIEGNTVKYYPMAFNVTWNAHLDDLEEFHTKNGSFRYVNVSSTVCQWDAAPLLIVTDCSLCQSYFRVSAVFSNITWYNQSESSEIAGTQVSRKTIDYFAGENNGSYYIRTVKSSSNQDIRRMDRFFCSTKRPLGDTLDQISASLCIIVRNTNNTHQGRIAFGRIRNTNRSFHYFLRETSFGTVHNISNIDSIHSALFDTFRSNPHSLVDIVDRMVYSNVMAKRISRVSFRRPVEITVVTPIAWISMIVLTVIAGLMGPLQEILTCISSRQYGPILSGLMQANSFDALSSWLPDFLAPDSLPKHCTYSQIYRESLTGDASVHNSQSSQANSTLSQHSRSELGT